MMTRSEYDFVDDTMGINVPKTNSNVNENEKLKLKCIIKRYFYVLKNSTKLEKIILNNDSNFNNKIKRICHA